jgi:ATP synthase, F1 epsilon subunit (delta in mitochondria)
MKNFKLKIVTPKGIYKETEIEILNIRTTAGQMGILASHLPLASGLEISEMNYVENGERKHFSIAGGFVYVGENETTLIVNAIESPEEIDLNRAEEAKKRAEKRLSQKSDIDIARAEIALKRALTRINVKGM